MKDVFTHVGKYAKQSKLCTTKLKDIIISLDERFSPLHLSHHLSILKSNMMLTH